MNQYLVITGASRGIGLVTAKQFAANGFQVINLSRTPCPVEGAIHIPVNLTQADCAEIIKQQLLPKLADAERIVLVHNAARLEKDRVDNIEAEALRAILEVNIVAPTILNRALIPLMPASSSIIYIGSTLSEKAVAGAFSYVTSKHALAGVMRATCQDLLGTGIHTTCICPGFTDTEMLREHLRHDESVLEYVKSLSAFNRLVEPQEIADMIFFAASHPVLNGAMINANLGQKES